MTTDTEKQSNEESVQDESWDAILSNPENIQTAKEIQAELQKAYELGNLQDVQIIETK